MRATWVDAALLWVFAMGVWPLADPGHGGGSVLSLADLAIHMAAGVVLVTRWKVVRR